jgi:hypothetical protein
MALTRRVTHRRQNRIGWETQMTRRGRGEAETEARAPENAAYLMLRPWSDAPKMSVPRTDVFPWEHAREDHEA